MSGGRPWAQPVRGLRESVPTDGREGRGDGGEVGSQCRLWGALKKPEVEAWSGAGGPGSGGLWKDGERGWPPSAWLGLRLRTAVGVRRARAAEAAGQVCEWRGRPRGRFLGGNVGLSPELRVQDGGLLDVWASRSPGAVPGQRRRGRERTEPLGPGGPPRAVGGSRGLKLGEESRVQARWLGVAFSLHQLELPQSPPEQPG